MEMISSSSCCGSSSGSGSASGSWFSGHCVGGGAKCSSDMWMTRGRPMGVVLLCASIAAWIWRFVSVSSGSPSTSERCPGAKVRRRCLLGWRVGEECDCMVV